MFRASKFAHKTIYRPDEPDVLRWIDPKRRIAYDNSAARPGANIIKLYEIV